MACNINGRKWNLYWFTICKNCFHSNADLLKGLWKNQLRRIRHEWSAWQLLLPNVRRSLILLALVLASLLTERHDWKNREREIRLAMFTYVNKLALMHWNGNGANGKKRERKKWDKKPVLPRWHKTLYRKLMLMRVFCN